MVRSPEASLLILTEDSSKDASQTISTVVRRILIHIYPETCTHRLEFRPLDSKDDGVLALRGNLWKSGKPRVHRDKVALVRAIAGKLRESGGFAVVHFDADTSWGQRADCENEKMFGEFRLLIEQNLRATISHRDQQAVSEDDICKAMKKLVPLIPFWSVESWLYQDTVGGKRYCEAQGCGAHHNDFDSWSVARGALDEVTQPKDVVCFGSKHNTALAREFPIAPVCSTLKSLYSAAEGFLACDELMVALQRTTNI